MSKYKTIKSIEAQGNMIRIETADDGPKLITIREALYRAEAIASMLDRNAKDLSEDLIRAAWQARRNIEEALKRA